jgi:apolipoprotein N-acyltransferase
VQFSHHVTPDYATALAATLALATLAFFRSFVTTAFAFAAFAFFTGFVAAAFTFAAFAFFTGFVATAFTFATLAFTAFTFSVFTGIDQIVTGSQLGRREWVCACANAGSSN